jgi:hypothetical protein
MSNTSTPLLKLNTKDVTPGVPETVTIIKYENNLNRLKIKPKKNRKLGWNVALYTRNGFWEWGFVAVFLVF